MAGRSGGVQGRLRHPPAWQVFSIGIGFDTELDTWLHGQMSNQAGRVLYNFLAWVYIWHERLGDGESAMNQLIDDIVLESVSAAACSLVFLYLVYLGRKEELVAISGWRFILAGFGLLTVGRVVDITDNFPQLNWLVVVGDTPTEAFIEKIIGDLCGFLLLVVGFSRWMPAMMSIRRTEHSLRLTSERLAEQSSELQMINQHLEGEVAQRQQAQQEREALIARLESQNAELERFAYTVSHDLKSPLVTIKGFLGLVKQAVTDGDITQAQADLTRMDDAADKMLAVLEGVLELSRAGRQMSPPEDVPFETLVDEATGLLAGMLSVRNVQVSKAPDLPVLYGDHLRLRAVLQNLIDNAVHHMGDQPQPRIEVGARREAERTVCYVRDNGLGIDPCDHKCIFDLFNKLDPTSPGTGLGLALVKSIVQAHGGKVWVESEGRGYGSTFCFTIPPKS